MKNRVVTHKAYASALEWMVDDAMEAHGWNIMLSSDDPAWARYEMVFWAAMGLGNLDLCEAEDQEDLP